MVVGLAGCGPGVEPAVPPDRSRPLAAIPDAVAPPQRFATVDRNVLRSARRVVPLLEYLSRRAGLPFKLAYFEDHETQLEALLAGRAEFAWLSPTAYVLARRRLGVVPLVRPIQDSRATYQSVLVVREDGPLHTLEDLRGRRVAFVRPDSTSGNLFPRSYLRSHGLLPERDFASTVYSGSHYKSLFLLSQGQVDAVFVEDGNMARASVELAFKARTLETVATIPHGPIVAHPDVPAAAVEAVRAAFRAYDTDPSNRALVMGMMREVQIQSFRAAKDEDYDGVRTLMVEDSTTGADE